MKVRGEKVDALHTIRSPGMHEGEVAGVYWDPQRNEPMILLWDASAWRFVSVPAARSFPVGALRPPASPLR